ncbi:MAG: hypothetical protein ACK57R_21070 [Dolichospermum sp.]
MLAVIQDIKSIFEKFTAVPNLKILKVADIHDKNLVVRASCPLKVYLGWLHHAGYQIKSAVKLS